MDRSARRLPDRSDVVDLELPGDYYLSAIDDHGEHKRAVWFLLPIHEGVRHVEADGHVVSSCFDWPTLGSGLHMVTEPPWTFRECADGSLEIRASILCGKTDEQPEGYFHGFLNEGNVWTWN